MRRTVSDASDDSRAAAFRRLADQELDRSYRLAAAILGDRSEAEDAVHDAFVTAWAKWGSLRDPLLFEHWFGRIVVNTCRNRLRRRARSQVVDISAELIAETPDSVGTSHDRSDLRAAISRLRPDDRVLLVLRFYRDLKVDDIALTLDIPSGTAMSRLHHALGRLRDLMADPGGKDGSR